MDTTTNPLAARIATQDTATLAECLLTISASKRTPEMNMVHAAIIDEMVARFPDVDAALEAWSEDLDSDLTIAEATVAALPVGAL